MKNENNEIGLPQPEEVVLRKELARAAALLNDAKLSGAGHAESCILGKFIKHHRMYPSRHPVWFGAPACECWHGPAGDFILKHLDLNSYRLPK